MQQNSSSEHSNNERSSSESKSNKRSRSRSRQKQKQKNKKNKSSLKPREDKNIQIYYGIYPKIQNVYNIWNIMIKYSTRQSKTIIITDEKSTTKDFERYYNLNRSYVSIHQIKNQEKQIQKFNNEKVQILLINDEIFSILIAKEQITCQIDLIIKIKSPQIDQIKSYQKIFTQKTVFIIIDESIDNIKKLQKKLALKINQIQITQKLSFFKSREIISDIKLMNLPQQTYQQIDPEKICKQSGLSPQDVIKRLMYMISKESQKKSKYLKMYGYVSYQISTNVQFNSIKYIWNYLKQECNNSFIESLKGMKKFKNQKGAVFQVPMHYKNYIDQKIHYMKKHKNKYKGYDIQEIVKMPELEDINNPEFKLAEQRKEFALKHKQQLQIFIGGVPYDAEEEDIKEFFYQKNIQLFLIRILRDSQGFSKGIAFALCADFEHSKNAINLSGTKFGERSLRIKLADQKNK